MDFSKYSTHPFLTLLWKTHIKQKYEGINNGFHRRLFFKNMHRFFIFIAFLAGI